MPKYKLICDEINLNTRVEAYNKSYAEHILSKIVQPADLDKQNINWAQNRN